MKKAKFGSMEVLGYIGIIIWVAVIILRGYPMPESKVYRFLLGVLPNLGAAWAMTMLAKWVVVFGLKKQMTVNTHLLLCAGILLLALVSEVIHHFFLGSPFDVYDMLITVIAQCIAFFVPVLFRDKYLYSAVG